MSKVYVGNLAYSCTEDDLMNKFAQYGEVVEAKIPSDRETGRPRGFGFVTMGDSSQAEAAINALHDSEFEGRTLRVNKAQEGGGGGGGGGGRGGFGGGRGRGGGGYGGGGDRSYGSGRGGGYGGGGYGSGGGYGGGGGYGQQRSGGYSGGW